jgi:hypothetical protein
MYNESLSIQLERLFYLSNTNAKIIIKVLALSLLLAIPVSKYDGFGFFRLTYFPLSLSQCLRRSCRYN